MAYYGSLTHFIRSLLAHTLAYDRFEVYSLCGNSRTKADPDSLLLNQPRAMLTSHCDLEIVYTGETLRQVSQLRLLDGRLTLYDNGYYEDQFRLTMGGYYARMEKMVSEMVPQEYEPPEPGARK
jgi:hypothetical protein